jgi:hypothetical protein
MTADDCPSDHAFLGRVANRIINDARGINRRQANLPSRWRANILSARARSSKGKGAVTFGASPRYGAG